MFRKNYYTKQNPDMIVSFGVLLYRLRFNLSANAVVPEYLMVQRKDSLCFVEVCRGRYSMFNTDYILYLFAHMTQEEKETLKTKEFSEFWDTMWMHRKGNASEFNMAKAQFAMLKNGVRIKDKDGNTIVFDLDYVISNCGGSLTECEWNIPRGRRNHTESNMNCALREFAEETGINETKFVLSKRFKPFVMDKLGSNGIMYRAIYYIAKCIDNHIDTNVINDVQAKEVRAVKWFDSHGVCARMESPKQISTFLKINNRIMSTLTDTI